MENTEQKKEVNDKDVRKRGSDKWEEMMMSRYPSEFPYWERYKPWIYD